MEANNFKLRARRGKQTMLDKAYNNYMKNVLVTIDEEQEIRWETYNLIIEELINQDYIEYFQEIKYRITDGEDPSQVILEIINRDTDRVSSLIWLLKGRLEQYIEEDYYNQYLM